MAKEAGVQFEPPASIELIAAAVQASKTHKYSVTLKHEGPPKEHKRLAPLGDEHAGHGHGPMGMADAGAAPPH